jgi:hypothetical protein
VSRFSIFLIRAVLSAAFAAILMRLFYPGTHPAWGVALGFFLVGASYLIEYLRTRK